MSAKTYMGSEFQINLSILLIGWTRRRRNGGEGHRRSRNSGVCCVLAFLFFYCYSDANKHTLKSKQT